MMTSHIVSVDCHYQTGARLTLSADQACSNYGETMGHKTAPPLVIYINRHVGEFKIGASNKDDKAN